jgi:hypothetical protein|tara:strand:+ start:753 stop:1349 length:597 start_codon:yes stop_codon:yes gene_type:complete
MSKYYCLFFSLFFLSISSQNDVEYIKKKYSSFNSYDLSYDLIVHTNKENEDVIIMEESGTMFGNSSSYFIKHKNMDIISDGEKIYNIIHEIKEINIIDYSENNQWNPINIFKTFLDKINSSLLKYEEDYISINFFLEELNRNYTFFLDKNYNIFKLRMKNNESNSSTTILINDIFFSNKIYDIGFDRSAYKDYFLNNL